MSQNKPVYLDYHATTPCDPRVIEAMAPYFSDERFGNVSARNARGQGAAKAFLQAKEHIAALIGAEPEALVLTAGATEANNLALRGAAKAQQGSPRREILIGALEHESVARTARLLGAEGFTIKTIPADKDGFITPAALAQMISGKTLLVSVMAASHEIGTIQPVAKLSKIAREAGALFHCDATQAAGKLPLDVATLGVDLLSFSAHKIYGPQGIGALYVRVKPPVALMPLITGGNQQGGLRAGTIPLALSAGFAEACRIAGEIMAQEDRRLRDLTAFFLQTLRDSIPGLVINGAMTPRLSGSLNIRIPGVDAVTLMQELNDDLCLSTGSACGCSAGTPSPVLKAIGLPDQEISECLRISMGRPTTREDVVFAAGKLGEVAKLKKAA